MPRVIAGTAVVAAMVLAVDAAAQGPLPPLSLVTAEGIAVTSADLIEPGRQLLLYVRLDCPACERLVLALANSTSERVARGTVVLIDASTEDARAYVARLKSRGLSDVRWYADPTRQTWNALGLRDAPAVIGLDDGRSEWTLAGVLNDPATLEGIARSWLER